MGSICRLLLDELPELGSRNLETLHQPLEDRVVTISRASGSLTFPANFILVAAMYPCPCGFMNANAIHKRPRDAVLVSLQVPIEHVHFFR